MPGAIVVHSKALKTEFVGKVVAGLNVNIITVYDNTIRRVIEDGGTINGIKPKSFNHGVRLVIEHEVAHIINGLNGRYGHDDMFMKIVSKLFKHTEVNAVNESIQTEEEDDNRDACYGETTKGICEGKQVASWRLHRVLSHRTRRTYNKKGGLNES